MNAPSTDSFPLTAPIPVSSARPRWRDTLISLKVPNYRLFTLSNIIAMTASWLQRIAQDWLVLEITGSPTAVGITVMLQFAPMLLLGLHGGVLADRHSKRLLLMFSQSAFALLSLVLGALVLTGAVLEWHIYLIALGVGIVTVVDNPARQVFVNDLVGPRYLTNAISLNSSVFQLGRLIGPALAGVLIVSVGAGWLFIINAGGCLLVVVTLALLKVSQLHRTPPVPRAKGQLREGLAYVLNKPEIFWSIVIIACVSVFTFAMPVILTAYAMDVYHVGAGGYGLFNTVVAAGALVGGIISTRRRRIRLRTVIFSAGIFGAVQAVAGFMPNEIAFSLVLVVRGFENLMFVTAANSLVQMSSNMRVRGRVMAVYVLVTMGGQAIGGPIIGAIIEAWGAPFGMVLSGVVPVVAALVIALILARRHQLRVSVRLRPGAKMVSIIGQRGLT